MDTKELTLLLVGAAIALGSSLITAVASSLITYWITKRQKKDETAEKLFYLAGKISTMTNDDAKWDKNWDVLSSKLKESLKDKGSLEANGLLGLYDGAYEHALKIRTEIEELKKDKESIQEKISQIKQELAAYDQDKEQKEIKS